MPELRPRLRRRRLPGAAPVSTTTDIGRIGAICTAPDQRVRRGDSQLYGAVATLVDDLLVELHEAGEHRATTGVYSPRLCPLCSRWTDRIGEVVRLAERERNG